MVKIEKKILFKLNNAKDEVTLPELRGMGHARAHIIALFEALEGAGFGEYRHGTKGRAQYSRFLKNKACPAEYMLILDEKPRGRRRKNADVVTESVQDSPVDPALDALGDSLNADELVETDVAAVASDESEADGVVGQDLSELIDQDIGALDADLSDVVSEMAVVRNEASAVVDNDNDDLAAEAEAAVSSVA